MANRNITRTSILLLILVIIIIGIILSTAKPRALGEAGLDLRTASVTPVTYRGVLSVLEKQNLGVDFQVVNVLNDGLLDVDAVQLPGASLSVLNT